MELLYLVANKFKANKSEVPPHTHNCFELVFYIDCESRIGYITIPDNESSNLFNFSKRFNETPNTITCTKNSFVLVPPKTLHNEYHLSSGKVVAIGFRASKDFDQLIEELPLLTPINGWYELFILISEIENELSSHSSFSKQMLDALLMKMIIMIHRKSSNTKTQDYNFNYVKEFVDQYFLTKINVKELATQFNYSESHFRLLFRKNNGVSIGQYITNKRIEYIKENLSNSNISIKQLSSQLAFSDYYAFSAFFRKHTGVSPKEYRKQSKKQD